MNFRRKFLKIVSIFLLVPTQVFSKNLLQYKDKIFIKKSNFTWFLNEEDK
jgi:hypothetical protein